MTDPTPSFSNPFEFDQLMLEPVHTMMEKGIRIDPQKKEEFKETAIEEWRKAQDVLDLYAGIYLNVDSSKQVQYVLYDRLNIPKRTKRKKPTADEAALRSIMAECKDKVDSLVQQDAKRRWMDGYICCFHILKIRGLRKRLSSYLGVKIEKGEVAGESRLLDEDGRIRGTISVGGTETGRFTHSKTLWGTGVNLATVPRSIRPMFVADDGYEMAEFDLERGESWVYAHLSQDPELLRIHYDGLDFHAETAAAISTVFGDPLEVDWIIENKEGPAYKIRYLGKKSNHAYSYRMGYFKGAEEVNKEAEETKITITVAQAKQIQELWLQKYFMIRSWWNEIERDLNASRTLITPYGRIHQFHDKWGESLFKSATAYVPQSTSVDYINRGILKVYHRFQKKGAWGMDILAQTHDSVLVQYKKEDRDEAVPAIQEALKSNLVIKGTEFSIPIDASYGPSWGELTPFELVV